jgi:hypothetical protein
MTVPQIIGVSVLIAVAVCIVIHALAPGVV